MILLTNSYLGLRLRYLRKQDDATQQQVADALGVQKSTVSMWENGKRFPDFERLEALADYFNVPIRTFFPSDEWNERDVLPCEGLSDQERLLLGSYRNLNPEGQEKVRDYAQDLADNDRYKKGYQPDLVEKAI